MYNVRSLPLELELSGAFTKTTLSGALGLHAHTAHVQYTTYVHVHVHTGYEPVVEGDKHHYFLLPGSD